MILALITNIRFASAPKYIKEKYHLLIDIPYIVSYALGRTIFILGISFFIAYEVPGIFWDNGETTSAPLSIQANNKLKKQKRKLILKHIGMFLKVFE